MQCFIWLCFLGYNNYTTKWYLKQCKLTTYDFSIRSAWVLSMYYLQCATDYTYKNIGKVIYQISSPRCCLFFYCCFSNCNLFFFSLIYLIGASKFWFLWRKVSFYNWDLLKFVSNSSIAGICINTHTPSLWSTCLATNNIYQYISWLQSINVLCFFSTPLHWLSRKNYILTL